MRAASTCPLQFMLPAGATVQRRPVGSSFRDWFDLCLDTYVLATTKSALSLQPISSIWPGPGLLVGRVRNGGLRTLCGRGVEKKSEPGSSSFRNLGQV
jgi:hypothetical protein